MVQSGNDGVARIEEARVGRRQFERVHHQLHGEEAVGPAVHFHQGGAPEFADIVDLGVAPGSDVGEIVGIVRVVGESADALRVVEQPVAHDGDVVDGAGHVVAPAFAHRTALRRVQRVGVHRPTDQAIGDAVGELVEDHGGIEGGVPVGGGKQAHVHGGAGAIRRSGHIRGAGNGAGERLRVNGIALRAAAAEIVGLEIPIGFAETQQVGEIVHVAAVVEDVQDLLVVAGGRRGIEGHDASHQSAGHRRARGVQMGASAVADGLVRGYPGVRVRGRQARARGEQGVVAASGGIVGAAGGQTPLLPPPAKYKPSHLWHQRQPC